MSQTQTLDEYIDSVVDIAGKELAKHIDDGILLNILVEDGWTKVPYVYYDSQKAINMAEYCEQTFKKNQWKILNDFFVFRKKKDAEWFILRWS